MARAELWSRPAKGPAQAPRVVAAVVLSGFGRGPCRGPCRGSRPLRQLPVERLTWNDSATSRRPDASLASFTR